MMVANEPGPSRASEIQVPTIIFLIIMPLFVVTRIWSRVKTKSGLGWDDWTILASATCAIVVMALMLASCAYGFGQHIRNLAKPNRLMTLKLFFISQAFYKLTINLTKMSILLLYLRIFIQRWFRIVCFTLLIIISCYMIAALFASIFQCTPVARAWDKSIAGHCINITTNWYANAGFSIATDLMILALPMYPIYHSKMAVRRKIALMMVFAFGMFVAVTSILRMQTLDFSSTSPDTTCMSSPELFKDLSHMIFSAELNDDVADDLTSSMWTIVEENIAIICACLPMMWAPLARLFPSCLSISRKTENSMSLSARTPKASRASQSHRHWQSHSDSQDNRSSNHLVIPDDSRYRISGESEDRILPFDGAGEPGDSDKQGIRKVVHYQVSSTNKT
ncbi:hypothetical protein N7539_001805 [Penicillium diatomitis]|uniref:Rhodopsin domain-containing protein n=1 Tax=Penicillium diatomitis TaxID=2819901 RepID=A0A9X0C0K6_9EURO|nr:uncharacterized protein N7539_001805 [Penicillium diatomitis]KAJ5493059.1 hypothetical protein N7539_001805 [Penicillium diatomitis]